MPLISGHFSFNHNCSRLVRFRFEGIPAASYILVVNLDSRISTRNPFPTLYYPNATEIDKAAPIHVSEGEKIKRLNLVIPKLFETIDVEGVLKFSDDTPAAEGPVRFRSYVTKGYDGDKYVLTDANGRFRLRLLKNLKGEIYADMLVRSGEYENCPQLDALLKGDESQYLKTQPIVIDAEKDIDHLVLRFPFPKCSRR